MTREILIGKTKDKTKKSTEAFDKNIDKNHKHKTTSILAMAEQKQIQKKILPALSS